MGKYTKKCIKGDVVGEVNRISKDTHPTAICFAETYAGAMVNAAQALPQNLSSQACEEIIQMVYAAYQLGVVRGKEE
jgi:hypothetical protein